MRKLQRVGCFDLGVPLVNPTLVGWILVMNATDRPNCNIVAARAKDTRLLSNFVDWLQENGIVLAHSQVGYFGQELFQIRESYESLFARFIGVDLNELENERRAILDGLREAHDKEKS